LTNLILFDIIKIVKGGIKIMKETRAELHYTISKLICEHNDNEAKELWEYIKDLAERELKEFEREE
jgi:hypothetical protein